MNDVGRIYLEVEDGTEYVKVCSPENEVILKVIFDINDKSVILYMIMNFIQNYVMENYPDQTVRFEFSDEWRRIFAGVGETKVVEKPSNVLTRMIVVVMIGYDVINYIFL